VGEPARLRDALKRIARDGERTRRDARAGATHQGRFEHEVHFLTK